MATRSRDIRAARHAKNLLRHSSQGLPSSEDQANEFSLSEWSNETSTERDAAQSEGAESGTYRNEG
jgi:hypothetical protein